MAEPARFPARSMAVPKGVRGACSRRRHCAGSAQRSDISLLDLQHTLGLHPKHARRRLAAGCRGCRREQQTCVQGRRAHDSNGFKASAFRPCPTCDARGSAILGIRRRFPVRNLTGRLKAPRVANVPGRKAACPPKSVRRPRQPRSPARPRPQSRPRRPPPSIQIPPGPRLPVGAASRQRQWRAAWPASRVITTPLM